MTEAEAEIIVERAREKFPRETPRIISDNGPQFIAKDFKEFLRQAGMTHARISAGYPQSNGKKERWYETLKSECIRPNTPLSLEDARRLVARFVEHYNHARLHSAIGYVTPADKLFGLENVIHSERDRKLETARSASPATASLAATARPAQPARRGDEASEPDGKPACRVGGLPRGATKRYPGACAQAVGLLRCLAGLRAATPRTLPLARPTRGALPFILREPSQERVPMLPPVVSRRRQRPGPLGRRASPPARGSRPSPGPNLPPAVTVEPKLGIRDEEPVP